MIPLDGAGPAPQITRTVSASGTWSRAVPRSWRTASSTWFMPWAYASARLPPWVFTGSGPSRPRLPSATYGPPSPFGQIWKSSRLISTIGVKWS